MELRNPFGDGTAGERIVEIPVKGVDIVLEIVVHEIMGKCPVYKVGDRITIDDPEIVLERTDALCIHSWFAHFQGVFREFCDQPGINIWMET